jgi:DNA-binding CsgD family transcriptional regulator
MPAPPFQQRAASPRTGGELQRVILAERLGEPLVLYRDGDGELQVRALPEGTDRLTIGRRSSNDIALPWDSEVSRLHAVLERIKDDWTVADDGLSKNGTFVNGEAVGKRRRLVAGDTITVGMTPLVFRGGAGADPGRESEAGTLSRERDGGPAIHVTPTERRVLVALCRPFKEGLAFGAPATNQAIADELFLSLDAVKAHLRILFQKFELSEVPQNQKRLQLVERAFVSGLVQPSDL